MALSVGLAACAAQRLELAAPSVAMMQAVAAATPTREVPLGETGFSVILGSASEAALNFPGAFQGPDQRFGASFPCTTTVSSVLEAYGFEPEQIERVRYFTQTRTDSDGDRRLQGFNAWVNFTDRRGHLVISMRPSCRFQTAYTRAGLELPGEEV